MTLNIKDEKVHELASELARETGKSMTAVVREALTLYRANHELMRETELRAKVIADLRGSAKASYNPKIKDNNFLYDDEGLPA